VCQFVIFENYKKTRIIFLSMGRNKTGGRSYPSASLDKILTVKAQLDLAMVVNFVMLFDHT